MRAWGLQAQRNKQLFGILSACGIRDRVAIGDLVDRATKGRQWESLQAVCHLNNHQVILGRGLANDNQRLPPDFSFAENGLTIDHVALAAA